MATQVHLGWLQKLHQAKCLIYRWRPQVLRLEGPYDLLTEFVQISVGAFRDTNSSLGQNSGVEGGMRSRNRKRSAAALKQETVERHHQEKVQN